MTFIIVLFILAIFIILLIPTVLFSVLRTILSILGISFLGRKREGNFSRGTEAEEESCYTRRRSGKNDAPHKKMFDKNEGEYVDFEEIKDDK